MNTRTQIAMKANRGVCLDPPEPVRCNIKPECEGCTFPGHGFICWSQDGTCMRDRYLKKPDIPVPEEAANPCQE